MKKPSNGEKAFTETGPIIQGYPRSEFPKSYLENNKEKEKVYGGYTLDERFGVSEAKK